MKINPFALMHPREKMRDVINMLAIGRGDVRSRLLWASTEFFVIKRDELPQEFWDEYDEIHKALNKYPAERWRGSCEVTMSRIKNSTGEKIARMMWDFWDRIEASMKEHDLGA